MIETITQLHAGDAAYPRLVAERFGRQKLPELSCQGALHLLDLPGVAIVGSRHASATALHLAGRLARELAEHDLNVISGYAGGVDSEAHRNALLAGGTTTIVLPHGIREFSRKRIYQDAPWDGHMLAISQFPPDARWAGWQAMQRNRLVVALAQAVVVITAGLHQKGKRSGTLDAGEQALKLKVPLFVIDPTALDSAAEGNTALIRQGAIPLSPNDLIGPILRHEHTRCSPPGLAQQLSFF